VNSRVCGTLVRVRAVGAMLPAFQLKVPLFACTVHIQAEANSIHFLSLTSSPGLPAAQAGAKMMVASACTPPLPWLVSGCRC
jgi:hypothetical protein